ncbi:hypothetical protein N7466_001761 [Penicillium verhagenii]|uniref:uncharacterized protein n=1 Tax=Penicillium verhagenii TaxID=1562060 RepID=UPI002545996B|nr:uncharacterized protein N7466_001761 [Penicillium verhagenii]KAJ5938627.1 hypothetical protein N7466_001761 [Penicillium verhagenii]
MNAISALLAIGEEVTDAEEESFLLFSQEITAGNLGFLDSRAAAVEVSIHDREYTIHQSPTLLSSSRAGGTTGAVLWKITPYFAEWISSPTNPLWTNSVLTPESIVAELGCGISALVPLSLAPSIQHYIATDQEYVRRFFRTNLDENASVKSGPSKQKIGKSKGSGGGSKKKHTSSKAISPAATATNITFTTLDWELDQPALLKDCIDSPNTIDGDEDRGFDLLLSCDCIYNEALVSPFVRTCAEICRLRPVYEPLATSDDKSARRPTVCIVAQQQRAPEVFEIWLRETLREFRVWRVSDEVLVSGLRGGSGYLVHLLLAREQ